MPTCPRCLEKSAENNSSVQRCRCDMWGALDWNAMSCHIASFNGHRRVPPPVNEPVKLVRARLTERASLKARLKAMAAERIDIPLVIGGKEIRTGDTAAVGDAARPPHVLADYHKATEQHVEQAIDAARGGAHASGRSWSCEDRAAVFLKAAELLTTTWRDTINAATMLGQSKTVFQAEIDAACEIIDFWRFNAHYGAAAARRAAGQRPHDVEPARVPRARGVRLRGHAVQLHVDRRQPADRAGADGQHGRLEAGVERDVLGALPDEAARGGRPAAGRHQLRRRRRGDDLEGAARRTAISPASTSPAAPRSSTTCGRRSARSMSTYRSYPRIVGETGGKDFIVAHPSADSAALAVAIVRGGFEFQGQKCSAASRVYVPRSLWNDGARSHRRDDRRDQDGRRPGLPELHGRGDRQARVRQDQRLHRARARQREDHRRRHVRRRAAATSSARRWSRPTTRATGCCARRSSARSSPPTSTTTRSGRRRSSSSTRRRPTR